MDHVNEKPGSSRGMDLAPQMDCSATQVAGSGPNKAGSHVFTRCKKETTVTKKGLNSKRFGCPAGVCLLHLFSALSCFSACQNSVDLKWHQVLIINLRPLIQNGCFGNVSVTCLLSVPRATLVEGRQTECCDVHTGFKSLTSAKLWCPHLNLIHSH